MKTHSGIVMHLLMISYARLTLTHEDSRSRIASNTHGEVQILVTGIGQFKDVNCWSQTWESGANWPFTPLGLNFLPTEDQQKWERDVRSASSLEELLMLTDFPDWKLWKCRLKLKYLESTSSSDRSSSTGSHRSTRYAGSSYSLEILKAIDDEWQKTQCMPRETCVDVAKELGTNANNGIFFKPPCVSVFRCSGCCNTEGVSCKNTSTTFVNKTLLSVIPFKHGPEPVLIKVANHTECKCMEPALTRRHVPPHARNGCNPVQRISDSEDSSRLCANGMIWDCMADRCVPYPSSKQEFVPNPRASDCEIDVDQCDCIPKNATKSRNPCQLSSAACTTKRKRLDKASCSCK